MTMSTEANNTNEKNAILRELDELMEYMDADESQETEDLIDPAFFIGNMDDGGSDVPTLTAVANEPALEQNKRAEVQKQPGLFSARVDRFKERNLEILLPSQGRCKVENSGWPKANQISRKLDRLRPSSPF